MCHEVIAMTTNQVSLHHHFPAQTTTFIGREQEIAEISALLVDPACRLLTLVGPGGIGKTRLALEVAERYVTSSHPLSNALGRGAGEGFPHGVYFIPLASLNDPDNLVPVIAQHTDYQFLSAGQDLKAELLRYLANKSLMLLLDNFEHLLDGIDLIVDILQARRRSKCWSHRGKC
jgi:predicted ATPase